MMTPYAPRSAVVDLEGRLTRDLEHEARNGGRWDRIARAIIEALAQAGHQGVENGRTRIPHSRQDPAWIGAEYLHEEMLRL